MTKRDWRRLLLAVPAWVSFIVGFCVLVAGWAIFGPDQRLPPFGVHMLSFLLMLPAFMRMAAAGWWRGFALGAAFLATVLVAAQIGPLLLWLGVSLAGTVPAAYLLVDRAFEMPPGR